MSTTTTAPTVPQNVADVGQDLLDQVALAACGRRPGKLRSCARCAIKAPKLVEVALAGRSKLAARVAAAICDTGPGSACSDCEAKAEEVLLLLGRPGADGGLAAGSAQ
jgi:hypothetical protein